MQLKKSDLLMSLAIGEICAWLMFFIIRNLAGEAALFLAIKPYALYLPIVFPIACAAGLFISYFLGKIIPIVYQFAKFVLVGGMNFLLDMGILNFLIFITGISSGITETGFKAVSFTIAVTNSYFFNKFWTFKRASSEKTGKEFFQFFIVSIIGFAINLGVNYLFVNAVSPFGGMSHKMWAQFSAMLAAITALFWNFLGYKFIVFDEQSSNIQKI